MKKLLLLTMFLTILGADEKSELIIDIEKSLMATCCWSGTVYDHGNKEMEIEIAGMVDGLVLGTDHSAENITGFYTKYGDGACDLAPLFGLSKRQVRAVAAHLGAPHNVITKAPTADLESLSPQKADEQALGMSYDQIDDFLEGKPVSAEVEEKLLYIYERTQHKRVPIPTIYDEL